MSVIGVLLAVACDIGMCGGTAETVPPPPSPEEWTFKAELAKPCVYHAREAYRLVDEYGLVGETATVREDLDRFMASAGKPAVKTLTLRRGAVDGAESYRIAVSPAGDAVVTAEDDAGIRRAACHFEDRVSAGDLESVTRKPWLRNRISRCYFAPIKRPPFNRDELMDDVDYYPDAYLNRLAHEGVNGLWLTIELRNIVKTSFNARDRDAPRRIAKLRRTVEKCRRYGIATWIFCIEPRLMRSGDPLLAKFPPEARSEAPWGDGQTLCPAHPLARQYVTEAFRDLFERVPGLAGVLNISHGERPTTCLSAIGAVSGSRGGCPGCAKLEPWQIHRLTAEAVVKGMRSANPQAEFLSWFYQPYVEFERAPWVADVARHLPEGVTMLYNFESGAVKNQLGRYRAGGDYWLSYVGPAPAFQKVAEASREANGLLGAKIQVGCSHECATVPFVPVPGLLYRKYAAMRKARCSTVMQCWYFGNYPGVMNKAAGELAFCDFSCGEEDFLLKLAKPEWGADAPAVARIWKDLSDAYAAYPLSNDMQYYGPFHAGVAWPLLPGIEMRKLGRTWKPQDAPSGDAIGECLENHTLAEAAILADRMRAGAELKNAAGDDAVAALEKKYAADRDRLRDLGVIKALRLLFAAGADAFEFYRLREIAVTESRDGGDMNRARTAVGGMRKIVLREKAVTAAMLPIARDDSRIGFHSEAEAHQFHAAKLAWRLKQLDAALGELETVRAALAAGKPYPLSAHERRAPCAVPGETVRGRDGFSFAVRFLANGDFEVTGESPVRGEIEMRLFNRCATAWPYGVRLSEAGYELPNVNVVAPSAVVKTYAASPTARGWKFRIVLDARGWNDGIGRRPGWLLFGRPGEARPLWPEVDPAGEPRLNIGAFEPGQYGRIGACSLRGERLVTDLSGTGWTLTEADGRRYAVAVPHSWNTVDGCDGRGVLSSERYARNSSCMDSYERKRVVYSRPLPEPKAGRRYFVRCEGASIAASVCVNGRKIGEHLGAFTAFCCEATDAMRPASNVLEIAVDNFSHDDVAPPVNADFTMYGGLCRRVQLIETPRVCIDPVTDGASGVRLFPDAATGRVRAEIRILGAPAETREFAVPGFRLWSPESPVVYTQRFEIASGDAVTETFGFRTAEFRSDGFYLNGVRRFIRGINYHQDREGCGWAVSRAQIASDVDEMKTLGADGVRTAHYPHQGFTYSQFDEKGLLAWCEQPNVNGLRFTDAFRSNCWRQTREMVLQLHNHPSIVTWSIFNELYNKVKMAEGEPEALMEELCACVKALDPTRPVSAACSFPGKKRLNAVPDVLGFNRYPGWYGPATMPALIDEICRENGRKGFLMTEYGAGASVRQHADAATVCEPESSWHTEDYQALVHADDYRAIRADPRVWGSFVWCLFDYGSDRRLEGEVWGRNDKGLLTFDHRVRKDAWHLYHANWTDAPVLHLVGSRTPQGTTNETLTVLGFSNVGDVELRVNGGTLGRRTPDAVRCVRWNGVPLKMGTNAVELVSGGRVARGLWRRVPACNYAPDRIGEVRLEDPLTFADGRKVVTRDDWQARRREILGIFQREMYGRMPAPIPPVIDVIDTGVALAGYANRKLLRMYFRSDRTGPCVNWMLLAPRHAKAPSPALMFLNYGGNHEISRDDVVPVPTSLMRDGLPARESTRGCHADPNGRTVYPVGTLIARGFAVLTACYCDISPDPHGRVLNGRYRPDDVLSLFPYDAGRSDNTTALGAWAWTLSRGLDLLERETAVDAHRVTVCGSSRLAKAALLAGAFDERFYAVVPNQTGGGGSPLLKRNYGENVASLLLSFPHWFCEAFRKYANNERAMPFDSHLLMACVAPRKLLIEGFGDPFYDTEGEFLALRAAAPVWAFLGREPLPDVTFPDPYETTAIGRDMGYVRRTERHGLSSHDWLWMVDFSKR